MPNTKLFDFAGELRHETEGAFLVHDGVRQVWLPKSMTENNDDGTFTLPEWLAIEKELV